VSGRDEVVLQRPARRRARPIDGSAERLRLSSIPAWVWLAGIVTASALAEILIARGIQSPTVFQDELIYAELSRSFADGGHFLLRDVPTTAYGPLSRLYPILIAPSFALTSSATQAFALLKAINAVLFALAALPTYLIAKRLLGTNLALVAAALTVAVPGFVYSGMVMTESAAYPAFLLAGLAMISSLERPSTRRQLAVLATIGLAFSIRAQAVFLLPAYLSTILLLAWLESAGQRRFHEFRRNLAKFNSTWLALLGALTLVLLAEVSRGRSPIQLVGSYRVVGGDVNLLSVPKWFLYQLADLDLYVGVIPFVAFCALVPIALRGTTDRPLRIFAATTLSLLIWMNLLVAGFSSSVWGLDRLHERNVFYGVPLILIAFLTFFERGELRRRRLAIGMAALAAVLPAALPFASLIKGARVDSLALLPWSNTLISAGVVPFAMAAFAAVLATFILAPRHSLPILISIVALNFVVIGSVANGQVRVSAQLIAHARTNQTWIDDAVGPKAQVAALWIPNGMACVPSSRRYWRELALWENEFFNRSIGPLYYVGKPLDPLPEHRAAVDSKSRVLRLGEGDTFEPRYLTVADEVALDAPVIARDRQTRTVLYRLDGPVHVISVRGCMAHTSTS
jgi:Dolichyl-phosphate-mannose-protein mannosyltransferase